MNEELHIKAFEILEKNIPFEELSIIEKELVTQAFGSEIDYQRMRGVTNLALEQDPILAPSLRTETALIKEFQNKHNEQTSFANLTFWPKLWRWLNNPAIKFALPAFVILFGLIWFLNQSVIDSEKISDVAHTEITTITEDAKNDSDLESDEKTIIEKIEEPITSYESPARSSNPSGYLKEDYAATSELSSELIIESDANEIEREEIVLELDVSEYDAEIEMLDEEKSLTQLSKKAMKNSDSSKDTSKNFDITLGESKSVDFAPTSVEIINDTMTAKQIYSESNEIQIDNTYGNTIETQEKIEAFASKSKLKNARDKSKYSAPLSQSAISDKALYEFLYTTY